MEVLELPGVEAPPPPGARREADFYPTPAWCTRAILPALRKSGHLPARRVLEPAAGDGAICRVLLDEGIVAPENLTALDIRPEAIKACSGLAGEVIVGDFLGWRPAPDKRPAVVVTNPPFCLALPFARHALDVVAAGGLVAMLLRLAFLETPARAAWLAEHPADVAVFPSRPAFVPNKAGNMDGGQYAYGWFSWRKGRRRPGRISYLTGVE